LATVAESRVRCSTYRTKLARVICGSQTRIRPMQLLGRRLLSVAPRVRPATCRSGRCSHTQPDVPEACEFDRPALNGRDPTVGVRWEVKIQTMP